MMPELYHLNDIKMAYNVIGDLHEIVITEMDRRRILTSHVIIEADITPATVKSFILDKKPLRSASDVFNMLDWLIKSYDRPVWRS